MLAAGERWGGGRTSGPTCRGRSPSPACGRGAGGGADLQFLLEDVGPGTRRLAELAPGEALMLLGPLGAGFAEPAPGTRRGARGRWHRHRADPGPARRAAGRAPVLLGFRSADHAGPRRCSARPAVRRSAADVTDDGSAGRQGLVTEPLRELLDRDPAVTVYACGPPPMLEAVRALCEEREVARAARAGGRHGVRLRRLLRLRGADPQRATCACASTGRSSTPPRSTRRCTRERPGVRERSGLELCGVALRGPVLNGSGTFDVIAARRAFGDALLERFPFDAYVSKTITLEPREGNPPPRLWETPAGMINSIGLPNKGLEGFLAEDLPRIAEVPVPVVVSVMGFSRDELAELVEAVARATRWR